MSAAITVTLALVFGAVLSDGVVQSGSSFSAEGHRSPMVDNSASYFRPVIREKSPRGRSSNGRSSDVSSHAAFAVRLYAALASRGAEEGDVDVQDVAFSPLSVASLLYALLEGANGTTAAEIHAALNHTQCGLIGTGGQHECHRWMQAAVDGLRSEASASTATRVFHSPLLHLKPDYVDRLQSRYRIKTQPLDFATSSVAAEQVVNSWVADATRQRIQTLVPPGTFDHLTVLVFVNALFFKADWQTKFDEMRTRLRPFRLPSENGSTYERAVSTMHVVAEFPYRDFRRLHFEMIELPYTSSGCSMFVVLPHRGSSVSAVVGNLQRRPTIVAQPRRRLYNQTVAVFLPRFRVDDASVDLKTALGKLGIVQAFEQGRADLSGIGGSDPTLHNRSGGDELHVSEALHKVFIEVDEKGTRASAASGLVIKGRSMSSDPVFRADRPFLYFIRHNPTSSILFMGHVAHPKDVVQATLPSSTTASPMRTRGRRPQ